MPFDGSGNYTPAAAPNFPAVGGTTIVAAYYNAVINDIATALSNTLTRDGQGMPTANINWNGKNLTNVATFGAVNAAITGTATIGTVNAAALTVSGATTLGVTGTGNLTVTGTLGVSGAAAFGSLTVGGATNVTTLSASGNISSAAQILENGSRVWTAATLTNLNQLTNGPGYLTGITSGQVTTALGFTPANKAGDTFTGNITVPKITLTANNTGDSLTIGDDAVIGDINSSNAIGLKGQTDATKGFIVFGNSAQQFGWNGTNLIFGANIFKSGAYRAVTIANSVPSGGADGDIWLQY